MRRKGYSTTRRQGSEQVARSETLPAPIAGLNTRDPLGVAPVETAINLTNFIATPQGCDAREGYRIRTTGLPGYVETLAAYTGTIAGSDKLFAWSTTSIYDVTNPGTVGAAVVTGLTNARWSTVNFATSGGQFLVCANGVDAVRHYNGSAWVTWTSVGSPANPGEVSGVSPATLTRPIMHQRRLWFVQENSTKAWYLPVNSIGGAAASIDFGPVFARGGKLMSLASWSLDGGNGIRNFLVAISDVGDAVIYEGTDPSSATDWTISGTWRLGAPATEKCLFQFGGDVLYLSVDGLMPMSQYMQNTLTTVSLSDSIRPTLSALSISQAGLSGWQVHDVLARNLLVLNVPQINPLQNIQFVYNTITKGWSLFTGWPAQCFATLRNQTYFGGYQQVCLAFSGSRDGADANGNGGSIYNATGQQSFTYLDERARQKHVTLARINLVTASSQPNFSLALNADFNTSAPANLGTVVPITTSLWDLAAWDDGKWSGGLTNYNAWQSANATGYCVSVIVAIAVGAPTTWVSTDIVYEKGGVLS